MSDARKFHLMDDTYDTFFRYAQGMADKDSGSVEAPSGFFALFDAETPEKREELIKYVHDEHPEMIFDWPQNVGVYVSVLNNDGLIFVHRFDLPADAEEFYDKLETLYGVWLDVTDEGDDPIHKGLATDPAPDAEKPTVKLFDIIAKVNVEFAASQNARVPEPAPRKLEKRDYVWIRAWCDITNQPLWHQDQMLARAVEQQLPIETYSAHKNDGRVMNFELWGIPRTSGEIMNFLHWSNRHDLPLPEAVRVAWGV